MEIIVDIKCSRVDFRNIGTIHFSGNLYQFRTCITVIAANLVFICSTVTVYINGNQLYIATIL